MTNTTPGGASSVLSVAVVQGGPSTEAEVSRASARCVVESLRESGHRVVALEIDPFLPESLRTGGYDVVFPVAHGAVGEDGSLQGLLEVLALPYVGSDVLASALAMHKRMARIVFSHASLPIAPGLIVRRGSDTTIAAQRARAELGASVVVKPSSHGSAIGVTRLEAATVDDLASAIVAVWRLDAFAIVESFIKGREITCGVLDTGEGGPVALPPTEILSPYDPFFDYRARYTPGRSQHVCPAPLPLELLARVQDVAVAAHVALGCRDLSRVDFIVDDRSAGSASVTLLEVNTLPGMTTTSLYPEAAAATGMSMTALCTALVTAAYKRGPTPRSAALPLPR